MSPLLLASLLLLPLAEASGPGHGHEARPEAASPKPAVAMQPSGKPVRAGELVTAGSHTLEVVDQKNARIELAPHSVAEFTDGGDLALLRGSALVESRAERSLATSSARVDFVGRVLLSYDHKSRSTSAFVLEGEARIVNPTQADRSLRIERFRGATLEVSSVLPQLIRQLDLASVRGWLTGYAWPEERAREILKGFPGAEVAHDRPAPEHLADARLEDYFSAIDTADDDVAQPDYYERKFADPDRAVAEAKSAKKEVSKAMSPEEAALISLPSTKIDLGFEFFSGDEEALAKGAIELPRQVKKPAGREPASLKKPVAVEARRKQAPAVKEADGSDPEVNQVLERLREIRPRAPVVSRMPLPGSRSPASGPGLVPDPVYDFSENF